MRYNNNFEAVAMRKLSLPSDTINQDLKVIRLIDYLATGVDEGFTHEYTQVGNRRRMKSRSSGDGATSKHKSYCLSCVNTIISNKVFKSFKNLTWEKVHIPRIPLEFSSGEGVIQFIKSCDLVMDNMSSSREIKVTKDPMQVFKHGNKYKLPAGAKLSAYSLLYGYLKEKDVLLYTLNNERYELEIQDDVIQYDSDLKYIDQEIENQRPAALDLLKLIFESTVPSTYSDIASLSNQFKKKIPLDGYIFMSSKEIEGYLPLLEYFNKKRLGEKTHDSFLKILQHGMNKIKNEDIKVGNFRSTTSVMYDVIVNGDYRLKIGYANEGNPTHSETFNTVGETVYVGYIDEYEGQGDLGVIPVYFTSKKPEIVSKMNEFVGKKTYIPKLNKLGTSSAMRKVNTYGNIKLTGDGSVFFQLPTEVYSKATSHVPRKNVKPGKKSAFSSASTRENELQTVQTPTKTSKSASEDLYLDTKPTTKDSTRSRKTGKTKSSTKSSTQQSAHPLNRIDNMVVASGLLFTRREKSRTEAIKHLHNELKSTYGQHYSLDNARDMFNRKHPFTTSELNTKRLQYNALFDKSDDTVKFTSGVVDNINSLIDLGHVFTDDEIEILFRKGVKDSDLSTIFGNDRVNPIKLKVDQSKGETTQQLNDGRRQPAEKETKTVGKDTMAKSLKKNKTGSFNERQFTNLLLGDRPIETLSIDDVEELVSQGHKLTNDEFDFLVKSGLSAELINDAIIKSPVNEGVGKYGDTYSNRKPIKDSDELKLIISNAGRRFNELRVPRNEVIKNLTNELNVKFPSKYNLSDVRKMFNDKYPFTKDEINQAEIIHDGLFDKSVQKLRLGRSALESVRSLINLGYVFTKEEIKSLLLRGLTELDLSRLLGKNLIDEVVSEMGEYVPMKAHVGSSKRASFNEKDFIRSLTGGSDDISILHKNRDLINEKIIDFSDEELRFLANHDLLDKDMQDMYRDGSLQESFSKVRPVVSSKGKSSANVQMKADYSYLFGQHSANAKLNNDALLKIDSLVKKGHVFTNDEVNTLVRRGLKLEDIKKHTKPQPINEVRVSVHSFNIRALLENAKNGL